jgi:hypothetical protein
MRAALLALQVLAGGSGDWQQDLSYRITASLDEAAGVLRGTQAVLYRNRSPDTLRTIAFHLYLNAFRPGSRWADADSAEGRRRFNDLRDPDFGFNHVRTVRVAGTVVQPSWPFAPDSTVVRFVLPAPLAPGDSLQVTMEWDARPSTLPRRQGRRGRHFDFAQWYPRVVAYDQQGWNEHPLYPAGEFYGDFGTFLVHLDVPEDQVIGATGLPICGDPGWQRARRPAGGKVTLEPGWYRNARDPEARRILSSGGPCPPTAPGRKTVTWYAEDVHHFAMSLDPDFRYEEGDVNRIPVRVLYRSGSERTWGAGLAARRTETALAWLHEEVFGPWPWPQMTVIERLEDGGTEFPMVVMNGGPEGSAQDLILHEVGHNYLMGILANNEWRDGWLDEGFTSFQTTWFLESMGKRGDYRALERQVLDWDLDRLSEPVAQPGERFSSFSAYGAMTYGRGELFFHQLRGVVGDATMAQILRTYYQRYRLRHVDEAKFRGVAEAVSGRDLRVFFDQWLRDGVLFDYAVRRARRDRQDDGSWRTTVAVRARSPGRFPASVWVYGDRDSARVTLPGAAAEETVTVVTRSRPRRVAVDPEVHSHDWNMLNNQRGFGLLPAFRPTERYLGGWFSQRVARDRLTSGVSPTAWYNDASGWSFGVRSRDDYLGRFALDEFWLDYGTGWGDKPEHGLNARIVLRNPVEFVRPGLDTRYEAAIQEGRTLLGVGFRKEAPQLSGTPGPLSWGADLDWLNTHDDGTAFLDPAQWDDAATLELAGWIRVARDSWSGQAGLTGGYLTQATGGLVRQAYARVQASVHGQGDVGRLRLRARGYAGATLAADPLPRQRRIFAAGADPYQRFASPFLRSNGALLVRPDFHYHEPGGTNLRGFGPGLAGRQAYGANLELEAAAFDKGGGTGLFRRTAVALFGDGALTDARGDDTVGPVRLLADAGIGIRFDHHLGNTPFQTRVDLPVWVNEPSLAQDDRPTDRFGWRWLFSFRASW